MKGQTDHGMKEILQQPSLTPALAIVWVMAKWKKETSFMIYYFGFFIGAIEKQEYLLMFAKSVIYY